MPIIAVALFVQLILDLARRDSELLREFTQIRLAIRVEKEAHEDADPGLGGDE